MSDSIQDGGPAFPCRKARSVVQDANGNDAHAIHYPENQGMSLRQWYAGQALCGLLSNQTSGWFSSRLTLFESVYNKTGERGCVTWETKVGIARVALSFADAMIEAEKREEHKA